MLVFKSAVKFARLLRSQFVLNPENAQMLNGLLGIEALLLGIFILLMWLKK